MTPLEISLSLTPAQRQMLLGEPCPWFQRSVIQVRRYLRSKGLVDVAGNLTNLGVIVRDLVAKESGSSHVPYGEHQKERGPLQRQRS